MGNDFWAGVLLGFALSVMFWLITTKVLVARLTLPSVITELIEEDGTFSYQFWLENKGQRDAVDVNVRCTLYSTGWSGDPSELVATIALPLSIQSINVMAGRRHMHRIHGRSRPIDRIGPRKITFRLGSISDFEKLKLESALRHRLDKNQVPLREIMGLGNDSFVNIVVFAYDRFSGSRNVYTDASIAPNDIR